MEELKPRRSRISTEVEMALQENDRAIDRAKRMLAQEEAEASLFDDLHKAIMASIEAHHPDAQTLCPYCMRLHTLLARF